MADSDRTPQDAPKPKIGLILSGGGARAAYQVGVLKGIAELLPADASTPFKIICGTSAGAINAAYLACVADDFRGGVNGLVDVWSNFHVERIFRTDTTLAVASGARWFLSLLLGGIGPLAPKALLDNTPLRQLLRERLDLRKIQHSIDSGVLHAFSITAAAYDSGRSVTFYQGQDDISPWRRTRRIGIPRPITIDHLMASSAIPVLFPPIRIGYEYYGDGSMRQMAPLSPALHLGADRLLVIGARQERVDRSRERGYRLTHPELGQISGYILDTLFMDSLSADLERLKRINHTLSHIPHDRRSKVPLRQIELVCVFPSEDIGSLVKHHIRDFPLSVRYLLRSFGAMKPGGQPLMSYMLFEGAFCRELIDMGYKDTLRLRRQMLRLLTGQTNLDETFHVKHTLPTDESSDDIES